MFFLNMTAAEFLALFGILSATVFTLYLLSRVRRKQVVPTLRFWGAAARDSSATRRRRIQDPWSLILQLLALLLLCLAIAQLQTGLSGRKPLDHVLLLDASSWMAARDRNAPLMDQAKAAAKRYVASLPAGDRVMVVHSDALATPVTGFEEKRDALAAAIDRARPSASALDLEQAIRYAEQSRRLHARRPGEIVFAGAGRSSSEMKTAPPANFRHLPVNSNLDNVGLRKVSIRPSGSGEAGWRIFVSVHNFGDAPRQVPLLVRYGGAPVGTARMRIKPQSTEQATFEFRTRAAGWVETRLIVEDALAEDNLVLLEIPSQKPLRVTVFSNEPDLLRPVLSSHPGIETAYRRTTEYTPAGDAGVVVLDRFRPAQSPAAPSIWIDPPGAGRAVVAGAVVERWAPDHELGAGLKSRHWKLPAAQLLSPAQGDTPVALVAGGPVVLARTVPRPAVILGFHPGRDATRYDLMTPLFFANVLRWLAPGSFRGAEVYAGSAGSVTVALPSRDAGGVKVTANGKPLPFTREGSTLRFFAGEPGNALVVAGGVEQVYALTLPEVGGAVWDPPAAISRGVPPARAIRLPSDWWRYLAAAGGLILLLEYLLYGRYRPAVRAAGANPGPRARLERKAS